MVSTFISITHWQLSTSGIQTFMCIIQWHFYPQVVSIPSCISTCGIYPQVVSRPSYILYHPVASIHKWYPDLHIMISSSATYPQVVSIPSYVHHPVTCIHKWYPDLHIYHPVTFIHKWYPDLPIIYHPVTFIHKGLSKPAHLTTINVQVSKYTNTSTRLGGWVSVQAPHPWIPSIDRYPQRASIVFVSLHQCPPIHLSIHPTCLHAVYL